MKFYRLRNTDQAQDTVVVVAEDTKAGILLRWVPNTGLWHRATELENDFLFGDDGGTYDPITADEAGKLLRDVSPFDERRDVAKRIMARYRAQTPAEQHTNAEMGLSQKQTGMKPMSSPGLGELLRKALRTRQWRTVALYPEAAGSAPRQLVSDWSRRAQPLGLARLEIEVVEARNMSFVRARAVSQTRVGTASVRTPARARSQATHVA